MQSYALNVIFSAAPVLRSTVVDRAISLVKTALPLQGIHGCLIFRRDPPEVKFLSSVVDHLVLKNL